VAIRHKGLGDEWDLHRFPPTRGQRWGFRRGQLLVPFYPLPAGPLTIDRIGWLWSSFAANPHLIVRDIYTPPLRLQSQGLQPWQLTYQSAPERYANRRRGFARPPPHFTAGYARATTEDGRISVCVLTEHGRRQAVGELRSLFLRVDALPSQRRAGSVHFASAIALARKALGNARRRRYANRDVLDVDAYVQPEAGTPRQQRQRRRPEVTTRLRIRVSWLQGLKHSHLRGKSRSSIPLASQRTRNHCWSDSTGKTSASR